MNNNLEIIYNELCNTPSDINEHLPTLKRYAEECDHITEFGVRYIVSTYALLMGHPKRMISYDINPCNWEPIKLMTDVDFEFRIGNTLDIEIEETDLLFIDTLHNYNQLSQELALHANKVGKYIIFHDTISFGHIGESYDNTPQEGIWRAIQEFLSRNKDWILQESYYNNNGLTIIKKAP